MAGARRQPVVAERAEILLIGDEPGATREERLDGREAPVVRVGPDPALARQSARRKRSAFMAGSRAREKAGIRDLRCVVRGEIGLRLRLAPDPCAQPGWCRRQLSI